MYHPRSRTYYTLQNDNDFPLGPPLLLPQCHYGTKSEQEDFSSLRAHQGPVRPLSAHPNHQAFATGGQRICSNGVSTSASARIPVDTLGEKFCSNLDDPPRIPPGLGFHDELAFSHGDLATYCTALHLCESSSWPLDEDLAVIGSSGSLQHSPDTQDPGVPRFSLSSLNFLGTLGRGGYGKVLLADSSFSTRVAVKVLGKKDMRRDDVTEVKTEVRILRMLTGMDDSSLGAAFTQKMHSAFQTKEHVFMVTYWHCAPLSHPAVRSQLHLRPEVGYPHSPRQTLPNSVSLPIAFPSSTSLSTPYDEALDTLRLCTAELLLGLSFLHTQGIVHQDIKPANVLISVEGHVVITDFGSARFLPVSRYNLGDEDSPDFSCNTARPRTQKPRATFGSIVLFANDQVSYTERYAAPELLEAPPGMEGRNILLYDERVDFYSLGVTLRELASGNVAAGINNHWDCASDGARHRHPAFDGDADFVDLCEQLVARDPDQRLHGSRAMGHSFFDPVRELWDDIAALRHPPFTKIVWPEVDEDTRLDVRAYSGDDGDDSYECDGNVDMWIEAVGDIPFDVNQPLCEQSYPSEVEFEGQVESPPFFDAADAQEQPVEELGGLSTDWSIALPPLSLLPTIPSLDSSSPGSVKNICEKGGSSDFLSCHPVPDVTLPSIRKSESAPLRRRPVVHDLRRAFQLSSDPSYAHPSHPTRSAAHVGPSMRRNANIGTRRSTAKHAGPALSFEHEITIALLATMGDKNAPMATLRCSPAPEQVAGHGRREKARSVLRKLKGLVPY
ncbi:kinase-like protein [Lentinus tigrinus ALCF2SS1-7]|uniref:non-specific serine/threonine protein kinase n=1 Tax=Lentinus tigrinus ALCF2SS1-6 TaxID=1328759 RepID=A0A5C2SEI6_9APHY|nr:kinase-like protein [Lentinus tigrinus ALCF2SS1-6]RPD76186.1 kinase-like protein [Lentinus tigrinus ALCF2SS1-7]